MSILSTIVLFTTIIVAEYILAQCPRNFDYAKDTNATKKCYGEIVHANALFRHGNRGPYILYPTDPYENFSWPGGLGHLTDRGKEKEYILGEYLWARYGHLTGPTYNSQNFMINSSDINRTIESAIYFVDGYFSPKNKCNWNDSGVTQDVPIDVIPESLDNLFLMSETCPLYTKLAKRYYECDRFIASLCERFADEISYCGKYSGYNITPCRSNSTIFNLQLLYDTLYIESSQFNLKLPSWTDKVFPDFLRFFFNVTFVSDVNEWEIKRLKSGPLLGVFNRSMAAKIESRKRNTSSISLNAYSAHDSTIATILIALGLWDHLAVPYGACVMAELRLLNGEYCVTIFYQNDTSRTPYFLELPHCPHPCSYENFVKLITPLVPRDWKKECHSDIGEIVEQPEPSDWKPTWSYWLDPDSWYDKAQDWRDAIRKYWPSKLQSYKAWYSYFQ